MYMITDEMPRFHPPPFSHRILYAGRDHTLSKFLQDELKDCLIVRAPTGLIARLFIEKLKHSLLLFDEELPDTTGRALARFARKSAYKGCPPMVIVKRYYDNFELLAKVISNMLAV